MRKFEITFFEKVFSLVFSVKYMKLIERKIRSPSANITFSVIRS